MARSSRAPISFEAATAVAKSRAAVQDRLTHSLPIASISPSARNPRQRVEGIAELAESLRAHGLLQPVVVRRRGAAYELIAGHRRLEAAKMLGWMEIAAVVRDETEDQAYILTLVENLQREDLTPKEEAAALEVLVRERGWTTRQVGEAVKRSHMYVSRRLRVFEDDVLAAPVLRGDLPVSTAEELLRADAQARMELVDRAVAEKWGQSQARRALLERNVPDSDAAFLQHLRKLHGAVSAVNPATLSPQSRSEARQVVKALRLLLRSANERE